MPTKTPTPRPTKTPTPTINPTATPLPTPIGISCGYIEQDCCPAAKQYCIDPSLTCNGNICVYPTLAPTKIPTPTTRSAKPGPEEQQSQPNPIQKIIEKIPFIPKQEPVVEKNPSGVSGKVQINNSINKPVGAIYVVLYTDKNDIAGPRADARGGTYSFDGLEFKEYKLKAWVRTSDGAWYQNKSCTPIGGDYDCTVKPGQTKNLEVDIGPQGLRGVYIKTQEISQNLVQNIGRTLENLPVVGTFFQIFIISAF